MHRAGKPSKQRSKAIIEKLHVTVREGCYYSEWPGGTQLEPNTFNQIPACAFRTNDFKALASPYRCIVSLKSFFIDMTVGKSIKRQESSLCCEEIRVKNLSQPV